MLSRSHSQACQNLLQDLRCLQEQATMTHGDISSLQQAFEQVQQTFAQDVMGLSSEGLDPAIASRWQSLQTEMHRTLRLLATDLLFLRSCRQATTRQQRLGLICDRIQQMIDYCQVMESTNGRDHSLRSV